MAYVGCIAGAALIEDYVRQLRGAGFQAVQVVDTRKDLNAYAQLDDQALCCSPASSANSIPVVSSCCAPGSAAGSSSEVHKGLAELLRQYDINDYAASVQVFALKV